MTDRLDRLHRWMRSRAACYRLAIVSRILLALAFIPTGMVKLLGRRFTLLPTDTPIGAFFEAMYQTGVYWRFIGLGQVVAGLLLLVPRTSTLGAVAFFPIILNVLVITWALEFRGTGYITTLMLLANLFLLAWDYHRLRSVLVEPSDRTVPAFPTMRLDPLERAGYALGTVSGFVVLLSTRSLATGAWVPLMLGAGAVAGGLVLLGWIRAATGGRLAPTR
ncbi:MAG: hypothetical protein FJ206_16305 [Gemmatimonadetes bacterium]|nr:hypothetical protein [Gemmatimonadota bacterium]